MPGISHHRRFTANHTWHVEWPGHRLFVKVNPNPDDARAERDGHAQLRGWYPMPTLRTVKHAGGWTIHVYDRWPYLGADHGLLVDAIAHADLSGDYRQLDACLTAILDHYSQVIDATLRLTATGATVGKLYRDRAVPGGRLDQHCRPDTRWRLAPSAPPLRLSELSRRRLIVNGTDRTLDFLAVLSSIRTQLTFHAPVWAAITQGDPTDVNIGWSATGGPVWFDYDTGGLNALAGEFACFLLYQRFHGAWLTPHYNPAAFRDHPFALAAANRAEPTVHIEHSVRALTIDYRHRPSAARRHVLRRYLDEIVAPLARHLGIDDVTGWLRPYLVMRLLAVYNIAAPEPRDTALSLALLAEVCDPIIRIENFLALSPHRTEATPS